MITLLPRKPLAVVFDMDGLIFDTEAIALKATETVAQRAGLPVSRAFALSTIGLPIEATNRVYVELLGPEFDFEGFWRDVGEGFYQIAETELKLKPGVLEFLDLLDLDGLPRAICTSSSHTSADRHLAKFGLTHRFQEIVARGDYSLGKPYPEPYLKAAARLGVDPAQCLALEDSYNGVRSASSAGMMTIMIPDLLPATDEMEEMALKIAKDLHEVGELVRASLKT